MRSKWFQRLAVGSAHLVGEEGSEETVIWWRWKPEGKRGGRGLFFKVVGEQVSEGQLTWEERRRGRRIKGLEKLPIGVRRKEEREEDEKVREDVYWKGRKRGER